MAILITGGLGYIGSHTAVVFADAGYDVVIVDNLSNTDISVLSKIEKITGKRIHFYQADLRDKEGLKKIFAGHKIDGVVHFAAKKAVGESCEKPFEYYDNNIVGGNCLYEIMDIFSVKHIVFSSSCTVYNTMDNHPPYDEHTSLKTINPYGSTKLISEIILQDLAVHKGFHAFALRYFNPIGAHPTGEIGENPRGIPNNLLPYVYGVLLGKYEYLSVRGNDYPTPDGTCIRDYLHVMDLAEAHLKAFEKLDVEHGEGSFDMVNLGTGKGTSVLQIVALAERATGKYLSYKICPRRAGDAVSVYANPDKAYDLLGRKAVRTVEDAIRDGRNFIGKTMQ